jgi:hypothetical protein
MTGTPKKVLFHIGYSNLRICGRFNNRRSLFIL